MIYTVFQTARFLRDLDEFLEYLAAYDEDWPNEQLLRLRRIISVDIGRSTLALRAAFQRAAHNVRFPRNHGQIRPRRSVRFERSCFQSRKVPTGM